MRKKFAPFLLSLSNFNMALSRQNIREPEENVCTAGSILGSDARVTSNGSEVFPLLIG